MTLLNKRSAASLGVIDERSTEEAPVARGAEGLSAEPEAWSGYLAGQILALGNDELAERLSEDRTQNREKVAEQNRSVQASLNSE